MAKLAYAAVFLPYLLGRIVLRIFIGRRKRERTIFRRFGDYLRILIKPTSLLGSVYFIIYCAGRYEANVTDYIKSRSGELFVDLGANIGYYAVLAASRFDRVLAIEPEPQNVHYLRYVVETRGCQNIRILPIAVSDKTGSGELWISAESVLHSLIPSRTDQTKSVRVRIDTLDNILRCEQTVDLVKIDVEGSEYQVLSGAENTMDKVHSWVIEIHSSTSIQKIDSLLKTHGYETKLLDENHLVAERPTEMAIIPP